MEKKSFENIFKKMGDEKIFLNFFGNFNLALKMVIAIWK